MKVHSLRDMWARHSAEWRDTAQIASQWREAAGVDPPLLESKASSGWWDLIAGAGITLVVSREYEHLLMAMSAPEGRPKLSFFPMPHPSGLAADRTAQRLYAASTRNPNQVFVFRPASGKLDRLDVTAKQWPGSPLAPVATTTYPGSLYMHDLAVVGGQLFANAVGHNAVVRLGTEGCFERVWWPRCIERDGDPVVGQNHIQLNSIAAGKTIRNSFFSASSAEISRLRPGHLNYPVNGRGVIFSGRTREPICTGLTRPHSARLEPEKGTSSRGTTGKGRRLWVANSGYGELGYVDGGKLEVIARLPGWTRGLCIIGDIAMVGTSRVIPRFARYAPGLNVALSRCAIHAVSLSSGKVLAKMEWPHGNQVFALDWMDAKHTEGFVFEAGTRNRKKETAFFYTQYSEPGN